MVKRLYREPGNFLAGEKPIYRGPCSNGEGTSSCMTVHRGSANQAEHSPYDIEILNRDLGRRSKAGRAEPPI